MKYPNIPIALSPVFHNKDIEVPEVLESYKIESDYRDDNDISEHEPSISYGQNYCSKYVSDSHFKTQSNLK